MSKWTRFRDGVVSSFIEMTKGKVIETGIVIANEAATIVEANALSTYGTPLYDTEALTQKVMSKIYAKYPEVEGTDVGDAVAIYVKEMIDLNKGLIEDGVSFAKNKDFLSIMKKKIAEEYCAFFINASKKVISLLIEKYLFKLSL